ncbi:hypothetical protein DB41_IC00010 [Neochlamydia sp. TUME1]|nr:hypothetical protein DB41_IC00010 [Neochlamydia sp. TUME1]
MGSDDFSAFLFIKGNIEKIEKASQANLYPYQGKTTHRIKELKSKSNEFVLLSMKNNPQIIYHAFISDRSTERLETFQAFRSNHRFWRLSDAAILIWLKE